MNTPVSKIRQQILDRHGVSTTAGTGELVSAGARPDTFPKTKFMKLLEYKYNIRIEDVLFSGSLSEVAKLLHNEIDRSTLSKWRKRINEG